MFGEINLHLFLKFLKELLKTKKIIVNNFKTIF